ncbi:MAG: hypothetical protein QOH96_3863 [Blastocatellia bacterium]|jgi:hypothetical protein|nr:hypothetical protein [Blastocatellia bacterium]
MTRSKKIFKLTFLFEPVSYKSLAISQTILSLTNITSDCDFPKKTLDVDQCCNILHKRTKYGIIPGMAKTTKS